MDACAACHSHMGKPQVGGFIACCVLVFGFCLVSSTFVQGFGCFGADCSEADEPAHDFHHQALPVN